MSSKNSSLLKLLICFLLATFIVSKGLVIVHELGHDISSNISDSDNQDDDQKCYFCDFSHICANIFLADSPVILSGLFYYLIILSRLNKIKLSHLLFSKFSRGPPLVI
jgi:hypothetical protein